ncbi:WRKY DNA-binding protein 2 isoform 3 [Hibiscus syriacus]|uniref:WRKY DNA-binding protein 2 isoform 3 n=1 Tax=Hibiscus syriacus TaxID=106335 RepID=A0A6A2YD73_HIBSY|nr:WRKY DNA-binding protein 2 isoform 3 [Hibiscus syriacus]
MAGIDDNVSIIGDWIPPALSPRTYLTAMLGDDVGSKPASKAPAENKTEGLFMGSRQTMTAETSNKKDVNNGGGPSNESDSMFEQKSSSRGGLVERMAARAGFNAPRLNTESIRSADPSLNPDIRSPYLTIPPGISPTTLLESPVFVSNSLAQPSPTTGKFPFIPNVNDGSCNHESHDKSEDNYFEDINASFTFKPVAKSNSSFFLGAMSKVNPASLPRQSFPNTESSIQSERSHASQSVDPRKLHPQNGNMFSLQADFSRSSTEKDSGSNNSADQRVFDPVGVLNIHSLLMSHRMKKEIKELAESDVSSTFSNDEDEDDRGTHGSLILGYDGEGDESESKRRFILPDNQSYYKCTIAGCTHNHDVPAARNSGHANSATSNPATAMASSIQPCTGRSHHNFITAWSANFAMAGLGPGQPKLPVLPVHPYASPE